MKDKKPQLYVEIVKERVCDGPRGIVCSDVRKATKQDIKLAKIAHETKNPHKNEKTTVFYDEDAWPYYVRICGICGQSIAFI